MTAPQSEARKSVTPLSRPIIAVGIGSTVLIAVGAFILSFASLTDLAARSGINPQLAWIWPIIVDGLIVAATVAIVALAGHERKTLVYPWALLFLGAVVSTAANAVHAIIAVDQTHGGVPPTVSSIMTAMPPVVLLAITHLTVLLVQKSAPARAPKKKPTKSSPAAKAPAPRVTAATKPSAPGPQPTAAFTDVNPVGARKRELVDA